MAFGELVIRLCAVPAGNVMVHWEPRKGDYFMQLRRAATNNEYYFAEPPGAGEYSQQGFQPRFVKSCADDL